MKVVYINKDKQCKSSQILKFQKLIEYTCHVFTDMYF